MIFERASLRALSPDPARATMTLRTLLRAAASWPSCRHPRRPTARAACNSSIPPSWTCADWPRTRWNTARDDPATQAMLQDLYQDWDRNHGRHQTELQMLIRAQLVEAIGPEQAEAFIDNARMQAHKQLAPGTFRNGRWRTAHTSAASCCPRPCGARCRCCALGSTCGNTGKRRPAGRGARLPFRASGRLLLKQTIQPPMRPAGACLNPRHPP